MLKLILNIVQIIIGVYWAGDVARQNPKIDAFVAQLELGYDVFNQQVKDIKISEGLVTLRRLYGWTAIALAAVFFLAGRILGTSPKLGVIWSIVFLVSGFGWFSIKWCTEHKKTISQYGSQIALMVFGPLLLGSFDILMGTPFVQIIAEPFNQIPSVVPWQFPHYTNPIAVGTVMSVILAAFFCVYYAITWVLSAPAAFLSAALVAIPVALARIVHAIAPRKAFFGFTVLIFSVATLWQLWL